MEILILLAVGFAFRSAVDHLKATRKASEGARLKEAAKAFGGTLPKHKAKAAAARHSAGWWLREAGNGFPVTRTGWHAGWIAHRTEYLQHAGHREEEKTRHAEAQATAAETVHDHAKRRAAAKARRDAILQRLEDSAPEAKGRKAVQEAADATVLPFVPRERPDVPMPADTVGKPEPGPYAAPAPTRRADGQPETDADKRFFDLRESGYEGPIDQDGYAADDAEPGPDASGNPNDPTTTEGEHVTATDTDEFAAKAGGSLWDPIERNGVISADMTGSSFGPATNGGSTVTASTAETTYDQQIAGANAIISEAEQELASLRARRLTQQVENLASAGLDPGSLGRAADLDESIRAQEKQAQETIDAAVAFRDGLIRDHSAGNEYHQSAPAGGAEKAFFGG